MGDGDGFFLCPKLALDGAIQPDLAPLRLDVTHLVST